MADVESSSADETAEAVGAPRVHRIPVAFDGEDLPWILERVRLDRDAFLALFSSLTFTVGFLGFSPGFAYLYGLPPELELPRRATPRPRVPAGSVALAGPYAAVYPAETPGGWNLLGRTTLRLFDPAAEPPALLSPGDSVRFEPA